MGRFLSWTAVAFAVYLIAFEGDATRAYHERNLGLRTDSNGQQSSISKGAGDSKYPDIGRENHSEGSPPPEKGKRSESTQNGRDLIPQAQKTDSGSKRALPAAALAVLKNPKVQEAVVEKGIEVVGKLVDKNFENIEHAQNKAAEFLKKEIKLDISPDKTWVNENMFVPSAYHIDASVQDDKKAPEEAGDTPFIYPAGMGQVLMNGCWGKDYKIGDPCYNAKANSSFCWDLIDGAAFIGVGFDGSGTYNPESRKMSIVQRNCANKAKYDNFDVPDTMNVHGIYDTRAFMMTFESRQQYQQYLQREAGMSGSFLGFSGGVKKAWGGSMQASSQQYMAIFDVDIDRYEIFMDEVKPSDLSLSFLREFMALPVSFFSPGSQVKYQNFIQRWGTHYIKSAKFGGQLEIIKTMLASYFSEKSEFAETMETEYKGLFASAGSKSSTKTGASSKDETKFTSTAVIAQGGSQEIATILSDVYSPTFKTDFKDWLQSIPTYPKAYRFLLGTIADLVNFRAHDLFLGDDVSWGCEGNSKNLVEEETEDGVRRYYTVTDGEGNAKKFYCPFQDREELDMMLRRRRDSLKRAIEVYMEEGPISVSEMQIPQCEPTKPIEEVKEEDFVASTRAPAWEEVTNPNKTIKVTFDMENDLARGLDGVVKIQRNMTREVRFARGRWFAADQDGTFHMFNGYRNGKSGELKKRKLSVFGLVLSYNSKYGSLELSDEDYKESKKFYPTLNEDQVGFPLARISLLESNSLQQKRSVDPPVVKPCNVKWSNALRLDPTTGGGRCLLFTASSKGDFFVVFATVPSDPTSWYYLHIGTKKVSIYKGENEVTKTEDKGAVSIGDALLYQSYFVCLSEKPASTLIEFGKTLGTSGVAHVYLMHLDKEDPLNVRFYAFGNQKEVVKIWDAHIIERARIDAECKGDTYKDLNEGVCAQKCHPYCDPFAGCGNPGSDPLSPTDCLDCRVAKSPFTGECLEKCPKDQTPDEGKVCKATFDVKVEYQSDESAANSITADIQNMPPLNHMTLCLWVKFLQSTPLADTRKRNHLVKYYEESSEMGFQLRIQNSDITKSGSLIVGRIAEDQMVVFTAGDLIDDHQWHHLCLAWNGVTGVTLLYKNGVKGTVWGGFTTPDGLLKYSLPGGGTLSLLSEYYQSIHLTEVNLWNKVLNAHEIDEASKSCVEMKGNVKKWFDFWPAFKDMTSNYVTPSECKSSRAEEVAEPPAESIRNDLSTRNKNYYLKWKNQAAKKYKRKGH